MCSFFTKAGRDTGHDVSHSVEWASTAIYSPEKNQIWRAGGGNWWDHTCPCVCASVCEKAYVHMHTHTKAWSWGNGVRLTSCRLWDRQADRTAGWQQNREWEQTEHTTTTERRVWSDIEVKNWGGATVTAVMMRWRQDGGTGAIISCEWWRQGNKINQRCNGTLLHVVQGMWSVVCLIFMHPLNMQPFKDITALITHETGTLVYDRSPM